MASFHSFEEEAEDKVAATESEMAISASLSNLNICINEILISSC
jgi:hypothetical protein